MTNVQLYLAMGIPSLLVLFGIILNRQDMAALRAEVVSLRDAIHRDMVQLHERVAVVEERSK